MELYTSREKPYRKLALLALVLSGILMGVILTRIFITPFQLTDNTMEPTIMKGETAWFLTTGTPGKGDIVLYESPLQSDHYITGRVIALPDDMVEVRKKTILVNGKALKGDWEVTWEDKRQFPAKFTLRDSMPPMKMQIRNFFILSDNLDFSMDSRTFGPVDRDKIEGTFLFKK